MSTHSPLPRTINQPKFVSKCDLVVSTDSIELMLAKGGSMIAKSNERGKIANKE